MSLGIVHAQLVVLKPQLVKPNKVSGLVYYRLVCHANQKIICNSKSF
jgi:hypothetical protein